MLELNAIITIVYICFGSIFTYIQNKTNQRIEKETQNDKNNKDI